MLNNAKNVLISGGTFSVTHTGLRGIDLLREATASGAFHDSAERYDPPKCHPGTRLAIINEIMGWIEDDRKTSFVIWLLGPAGSGKSALAQTLAEMLAVSGALAASFFWSRSIVGRNDEKRLIPSLAYQLLLTFPQMRSHVEAALETDPVLLDRSLRVQMERLVIKPLENAFPEGWEQPAQSTPPKVIILDGLDECGAPKSQRYILEIISSTLKRFPIPIRILIASRPEQEIRDSFNSRPLSSMTHRMALDDTYLPDHDIRLFLEESFDSLKRSHTLGPLLPPIWPHAEALDALVGKSSGQFIYAATVVKFVSSPRHRPDNQLDILLGIADTGTHTPFAELDALYRHIFSSVDDLPRVLEIVGYLLLPKSSILASSADFIESLFSYKPGDVQVILTDLHSVVNVPEFGDPYHRLRFFHASLQDFLTDCQRSKEFHIDGQKAHAQLAQNILRYLNNLQKLANPSVETFALLYLDEHTLKAHPTKALLKEFFTFDLKKWVSTLIARCPRTECYKIYHSMFKLSGWFRKQDSLVKEVFGSEKSLHAHHSHSLDAMMEQIIREYFNSDPGRNKIAFITHPNFLQVKDLPALLHALSVSKGVPRLVSRSGQTLPITDVPFDYEFQVIERLCYGTHEARSLYHHDPVYHQVLESILDLQEFLRDRKRSLDYFVDGGIYAALCLKIGRDAMPWVVEHFPFYLANADYTVQLADYLRNHVLKAPTLYSEDLRNAVDAYLERGLQPVMEISQKRASTFSEPPRKRPRQAVCGDGRTARREARDRGKMQ